MNISGTWGSWSKAHWTLSCQQLPLPLPRQPLMASSHQAPPYPQPGRHPGRAWSVCPGQLDRLTRSRRLNHPDWLSASIALTQQMPSSGMLSADRVVASATVGRDYRGAAPSPELPLSLSINRVFNKSSSGSPTNRLRQLAEEMKGPCPRPGPLLSLPSSSSRRP